MPQREYAFDRIFSLQHTLSMENVIQIVVALSDPNRLRSLALMAGDGEVCVCEVCYALEIAQPKASKHLAALREAGLVRARRDAQWTFYGLADDLPSWGQALINAALLGMSGSAVHAADLQRLHKMPVRPPRTRVH